MWPKRIVNLRALYWEIRLLCLSESFTGHSIHRPEDEMRFRMLTIFLAYATSKPFH